MAEKPDAAAARTRRAQGWMFYAMAAAIIAEVGSGETRITEGGDTRITEAGDTRVTE